MRHRIGPLRKVKEITRHATDLFDQDRVTLVCGHTTNSNGQSARCSECALTDNKWRSQALPKLRLRLHEVEGIIASDNAKWGSHSTPGHATGCKLCRERAQLANIIAGGAR
jgi:hypothetical protein